jgi:hypothetical protein
MMRRHQLDADNAVAFIAVMVAAGIIGPVVVLLVMMWSVLL